MRLCVLITILLGLMPLSPAEAIQGHTRLISTWQDTTLFYPSQWSSAAELRVHDKRSLTSSSSFEWGATATSWYRQHPSAWQTVRPNQRIDLTKVTGENDHSTSRGEIDRLAIHATIDRHQLTVGRQAIGFGRIVLYSPLDIIAPFAPDALITDVRPGIDALRWNINLSAASQLQAIHIWGQDNADNSTLVAFEALLDWGDLLLLGGELAGRPMMGAGIAGQWSGIGLKLEATTYGRKPHRDGDDPHDEFTIAAVECDARLFDDVYLTVDYLFNGCGSDKPEDATAILASAFYQEQRAYLSGRHYLISALSAELHPLVTAELFGLLNLEDHSVMIRPGLNVSLSDNLSLDMHYAWLAGHRGSVSQPASEFGDQGDQASVFLSYYF
ncbi:hypothetical protein HTZ97_03900 [Desulfuromonas acetoxidans]|uniref:Alginate export domain-containing protein n=1 Tax=Desulfuromonas acetoxidans (strain DSM 684 / 11070) TaxID=281689 RepID=Q1JWK5_DESA6|nr:hypothetical protein [Desulfuromonas acetoxidans]EAT14674.1 conserved hypothetical protein [Desulfuromonas acetoxidans DSM 684]MBF0645032.1 hypothetical protein [Desulfuromonas acetoxidans]NVD23158.1 hypothetical protein [Desulfuromonas acetoxidans]NVE15601.1 hypothetical protein [Desulfuromonas acetoxidans]